MDLEKKRATVNLELNENNIEFKFLCHSRTTLGRIITRRDVSYQLHTFSTTGLLKNSAADFSISKINPRFDYSDDSSQVLHSLL